MHEVDSEVENLGYLLQIRNLKSCLLGIRYQYYIKNNGISALLCQRIQLSLVTFLVVQQHAAYVPAARSTRSQYLGV